MIVVTFSVKAVVTGGSLVNKHRKQCPMTSRQDLTYGVINKEKVGMCVRIHMYTRV